MSIIINCIRGFCMALADSVPGVSGGTIAFLLGFYDEFITSLDNLIYGSIEEKKKSLLFLVKLGIGWVAGFLLAVLILTNLFESHIYVVSSVFIGFIIFSIPLIIKEEQKELKGKYKNIFFTIIGILIVALITYFNPINSDSNIDITRITLSLGIYVFISAAISISAMVLPGISGSTLLLIFGLYLPIITAVKELLNFNFSYLPVIIIFGLGVIVGVCLIIKLIRIALEKYRSQTIYLILGLMIGSIYAIIMGPTTLDTYTEPMTFQTFSILFFVLGGIIIIGLQFLKSVFEKKKKS